MWVIFAIRILFATLMTPAARLSAAIEVLADIEARRRPAADALKDWGLAHRFAGSGDRAAIAGPRLRRAAPQGVGRVPDGRRTPRASCSACCSCERGLDVAAIAGCSTARALRRRR